MDVQKLKLYHYPLTRSARVRWLLWELIGGDFEEEVVPLYDGAQYEDKYLCVNPNHCVPTLQIDMASGETLNMIESGAMVALLADAFPQKKLAPPAGELSLARADYLQMLHFGSSQMDMILWQLRCHAQVLPLSQRDPRTVERYRAKFLNEVEPQLKARLRKTAYICGDEFSAADCVIGYNVRWSRAYDLCKHEIFDRYMTTVSARPAYIAAFADAHQHLPPGGRISTALAERFTG